MQDADLLASNKLGIAELEALYAAERDLSALRLLELTASPIPGDCDLAHLQAIHRHLFQDLYPWAGELREVSISKGNLFALPQFIEPAANKLFAKLATEQHLVGLDRPTFIERTAFYLGEINALHPFREGNGRAQRAFLDELVAKNDYAIDWTRIGRDENLAASQAAMDGDNRPLEGLLERALINTRDLQRTVAAQEAALREAATAALGQPAAVYASNGGSYQGPVVALVGEIALQRVAPATVIAHDNRGLGLAAPDPGQSLRIAAGRAGPAERPSGPAIDLGR